MFWRIFHNFITRSKYALQIELLLLEYNSNSEKRLLLFCTIVPNNVEDETAGCIHFADQFTNRYGECHPEFFPGSLDEAVKEACLKSAKDVSKM